MSIASQVFQLSALSQNDPGVADGSTIVCNVTNINNGSLRSGSFPLNSDILLPIPPNGVKPAPATPTWFLIPTGEIADTSYELQISCPTDPNYPAVNITLNASDVQQWANPINGPSVNQIYQEGEYGIFGFAQSGPNGLIYTITAGVLYPVLQA